jgi:2-polyprenyl-3-methyl-5-hydroxy-6-metoxy-1,4-benzoquinol methylase
MENDVVAGQPANEVWNAWNTGAGREVALDEVSQRQSDLILSWLRDLGRTDLAILETGCGSGWMCARMTEFGAVTGIDLADEVIARAQERWPHINFIAGDFMAMDVPDASYDAVVSIETLSHVPDQAGYIAKVARVLKPGGVFLIATQNGPILRLNKIPPPQGWHRHWVDRRELRALIEPHMRVRKLTTVEPRAREGPLRVLAAGRVRKLMNKLTGGLYQKALEHYGFGFSIVAYASKVLGLE